LIAFVLAALLESPSPAPSGPPHCVEATAKLDVELSTTANVAGDAFRFTLVKGVEPNGAHPALPSGTKGYGLIAYATHAGAGGKAGMLVLEPRYVVLSGGRHIPVMANPVSDERIVSGKTKNAPGGAEIIPGVGLMVGGYNALHRGKDVVLPKGTPLLLLVGDDLATSDCFVTPHIQ